MQSFAHLLQAKVQPALRRRSFADLPDSFPTSCHVPFQVKEETGEEEAEGKEKDSDAEDGDENEDQEEEEEEEDEEDESIRRETRKARKQAELEEMVPVVTSRLEHERGFQDIETNVRRSSFPYRFVACR